MTRIGLAAMEDDAIYFKMVKKGSPEHIAAMGLAEVDVAKQRHGPIGPHPDALQRRLHEAQ